MSYINTAESERENLVIIYFLYVDFDHSSSMEGQICPQQKKIKTRLRDICAYLLDFNKERKCVLEGDE